VSFKEDREDRKNGVNTPDISYTTIKIDTILKARIDLEQKPGERNADTLNRILKEKTDVIKELREEIERLKTIIQRSLIGMIRQFVS
jgi:hypothetical protein